MVTVLILAIVLGALFVVSRVVIYSQRNLGAIVPSGVLAWLVRLGLIVTGCVVGIGLASVTWNWSETQLIVGLPIPVAAWELEGGRWLDFVSPISLLIWILDLIIWIGFTHLPFAIAIYWKKRTEKG